MVSDPSKHVYFPFDPCGRAVAESMDSSLLEGFQAHFNMEHQTKAAYFEAAIWMGERNYEASPNTSTMKQKENESTQPKLLTT